MLKLRKWREKIGSGASQEVKNEILSILDGLTIHDQAIALGLLVAACRGLGEIEDALAFLERGEALGVRAVKPRVELLAQGAALWLQKRNAPRARCYVNHSLDLVAAELMKGPRRSKWSRDRRNWFIRAQSRNLVVRGNVTIWLHDRPGREAIADAFEAVRVARGWVREQVNAVSLLCAALAFHGALREVVASLDLMGDVDAELTRRRFGRWHPHRLRIRWGRAVALGRLGLVDRAEPIMSEVVERFLEAGMMVDARDAVGTLLWIIGERAGLVGRARVVGKRYGEQIPGVELPEVPALLVPERFPGW